MSLPSTTKSPALDAAFKPARFSALLRVRGGALRNIACISLPAKYNQPNW
jgi:hypothetical protein